ncbi:MAG: hypothetical protein R3D81_13780 [Thalassovita sp.]
MMRRAYALGGMVDQYLTGLFVAEDPWIASISQRFRGCDFHTYRHLDERHEGMSLLQDGHLLPLDDIAQHRQQAWGTAKRLRRCKLGLLPKALG